MNVINSYMKSTRKPTVFNRVIVDMLMYIDLEKYIEAQKGV